VTAHNSTRHRLLRWWGWLLSSTLLLLVLVSSRYFSVVELDARLLSLMFRGVMLIAHFTALAAVWLMPVLVVILVWPRPRIVIPFGVLSAATLVVAALIDTQIYQLYRFHINAGVMNLLLGGAARETFVFSAEMYAQVLLIVGTVMAVLGGVGAWLWRHIDSLSQWRRLSRVTVTALIAALVSFHSIHVWADAIGYEPLLEQTEVLPMRYAATAKRLLHTLGVNTHAQFTPARAAHTRGTLSYPLRPLTCSPPPAPPNIVVILIDSWRFDELNAHVTPNIDTFAHRATRFTDHYSGGNATRIGVFSLFYSIPGTYWHRMLAQRQAPVLIEQLSKLGYDIQAFRSAPLHSPEFDRTVFAPINSIRTRSEGDSPAARDRDLTNDFIRYLDQRSTARPFFALLFYDAPHGFDHPKDYPTAFAPSLPQVNYLKLHRGTDPKPLLNRYRNSLHYVDSLVGEALATLKGRELLDDSIVIVTGDHGQEFNDSGQNYWGHASNFTRFQTGVPLVVFAPDLPPRVYSHRTTHFDVMPTLMRDYLGCDDPFAVYSVGRSLFEPGGRETIVMSEYADFAIKHADHTAIVREQGLELRDANHVEIHERLDPKVIDAALEQKTRFAGGGLPGEHMLE
jgi:membrane-anchored protein YejM (alkaline phosphatase superfamily)